MEANPDFDPVLIFAGTAWQAAMVQSLLANAGIGAFMKDVIMGTYNPWWAAPGGAGAVKVYVAGNDYDVARLIVNEYEANLKN